MPINVSDWTSGNLTTSMIPEDELKPLSVSPKRGAIWKSNNPEIFTSNGWLMQNARTDRSEQNRGGEALALLGQSILYLFHINGSGANKFIHLIVTNPQNEPISLKFRGSIFTNRDFPLGSPPPPGGGPSAQVSDNWLDERFSTPLRTVSIPSLNGHQIARKRLLPNNLVDGRFELETTKGVFAYSVITSSGSINDAINLSQGDPASGTIKSPGPGLFGREAGVCPHSSWEGTTHIDIPNGAAHVGLCLNTSQRNSSAPQEQTVAYDSSGMHLADSSDRTFGNYGHEYQIKLAFKNLATSTRSIRISFAHRVVGGSSPSHTYNGPMLVNGRKVIVFTTPSSPNQVLLNNQRIDSGDEKIVDIKFFAPGLLTIGHQLIIESI